VVEMVSASGQRVRLAPPIDARVLKAVLAGFG
jgi:transposase